MGNAPFLAEEEKQSDYSPNFWCELFSCRMIKESEDEVEINYKCKRCGLKETFYHFGPFTITL